MPRTAPTEIVKKAARGISKPSRGFCFIRNKLDRRRASGEASGLAGFALDQGACRRRIINVREEIARLGKIAGEI
jgi:hypothetical protein